VLCPHSEGPTLAQHNVPRLVTSILLEHTEHLNVSLVTVQATLGGTTTRGQKGTIQGHAVTAFPDNSFCRVQTVPIKAPVTLPRTLSFLTTSHVTGSSFWGGTVYCTLWLFQRFGGTESLLLQGAASLHPPLALKIGSAIAHNVKASKHNTNRPAICTAYIRNCNKGRQVRQQLPEPTVRQQTVAIFCSQQSLHSLPNSPMSM